MSMPQAGFTRVEKELLKDFFLIELLAFKSIDFQIMSLDEAQSSRTLL